MRKQLKQRAAMEAADSAACTFRPDIGSTVQVLALSSRAGNLLETAQVGAAWLTQHSQVTLASSHAHEC
jgi:DNA mismatch repair protein MutH